MIKEIVLGLGGLGYIVLGFLIIIFYVIPVPGAQLVLTIASGSMIGIGLVFIRTSLRRE